MTVLLVVAIFTAGAMFGACIGLLIMGLLNAAASADRARGLE